MSNLSLFNIESGLHELLEAWQEATTPETLAAAEQAIQAYAQAEVRKVDGIRAYLKACDRQAAAAEDEARLQMQRAKAWIARRDRLKETVYAIMQTFGTRKIEGSTGTLQIKGNGGLAPLTITDASLVPDELCDATITMPVSVWLEVGITIKPEQRVPSNGRIRVALAQACPRCHGLPMCRDSQVGHGLQVDWICPACNGSKTASVAGARLESRGEHLEVK